PRSPSSPCSTPLVVPVGLPGRYDAEQLAGCRGLFLCERFPYETLGRIRARGTATGWSRVMTVEAEPQTPHPGPDEAGTPSVRGRVAARFAELMRSSGRDVDMSRPVLALARAEERVGRAFDRALED